jgi:hypothetical protein
LKGTDTAEFVALAGNVLGVTGATIAAVLLVCGDDRASRGSGSYCRDASRHAAQQQHAADGRLRRPQLIGMALGIRGIL